ncbi:MAG: protein translocase SEC61 complex subunit gamma [Candidatus Hodarchaeales archaeon]
MSADSSSRMGTSSFYKRAMRILRLAKKPDRAEVFLVIKITAAGMGILGLIAFVIRIVIYTILGQQSKL